MLSHRPERAAPSPRRFTSPLCLGLLLVAACGGGGGGSPPAIGIAPEPTVTAGQSLPGVVVVIEGVRGGSGPGGRVRPGDKLAVDFTARTDAGQPLELSTMARGAIMVSGPTFDYQRVIASQSDVLTKAVKRALGAYTYTFTVPVPATYLAPLNDTNAITVGERTGQPLLSGTYTVGLELRKDYLIERELVRDPGNANFDFLLGDATAQEAREVVTLANCNQCHGELRGHGNNRNDVKNCLLCHTTGAEDGNLASAANGTPGVAIDFKVMIHKIHAGTKLPSVNGVATNPDGTRNYAATPTPYIVQGRQGSLVDYSNVAFPVWPSLLTPMPRDAGYTALSTAQKAQEDAVRGGPVECAKCHGDPDGNGPLPAPRQGDLIYAQPSIAACASCHDDWNHEFPYIANGQTMPIQRDNAACKQCHDVSGDPLACRDAHVHPLTDPAKATGVRFGVTAVTDVGNGNGRFETGEKVRIEMTIQNDAGQPIAASSLSRIEAVLNGPTTNPNLVHFVRVATGGLGAGPNYAFHLPENVYYEPLGTSGAGLQTFATARAPHWNVTGAATTLLLRTGTGFAGALAAAAAPPQNYLDLVPGTGVNFAKDNYIVIEDAVPGRREYLRVQRVEGDRLWFSSPYSQAYGPGVRIAHAAGSTVHRVIVPVNGQGAVQLIPTNSYSLDALTGTVTETVEFGNGEVIASYTTDFVVPANYPLAFNDSPGLDQTWGKWAGLPLLSGTYTFGIYGARTFNVAVGAETTGYTEGSKPATQLLRFGTATTTEAVARIDDASGCYACHEDIQFHGGSRRGYETCILCHGTAGAEDAATYIYPTGAATPGVTIDFRTMLHKIHHGKELTEGAAYQVAGFGGTGHSYEHVGFPRMPGGTSNCAACHGNQTTAWTLPAERNHPNATMLTRSWRAACASCHDSSAARAHIEVNTGLLGAEACAICHGTGEDLDVRTVHTVR